MIEVANGSEDENFGNYDYWIMSDSLKMGLSKRYFFLLNQVAGIFYKLIKWDLQIFHESKFDKANIINSF